ncbi:MAG TPA: recombinase family protein [Clostridia bacterium]|nr:recombinase family protein [Clostridia bacterium]
MKRVIGYLRVSQQDQNEERQRKLVKAYCKDNLYEYLDDEEIPETFTGTTSEREGLRKLKKLTKDDCDIIAMSETSRLSRNEDLLVLANDVNLITKLGIDVYFIDTDYTYKGGVLLSEREIQDLISEASANRKERDRIVKRTMTGRRDKASQGCFVGNIVPYGFIKYDNPKRLISKEFGKNLLKVDEEQRLTIETIFTLIGDQGYTLRGVAKYLNDLGIKKNKIKWTLSGVMNVVYNRMCKGEYNYSVEQSKIPAIVTSELFDKVQLKLKSNHLFKNKGAVHFNILKGLFKCPCGGNMSLTTRANNLTYYNCVRKKNPHLKGNCDNSGIKAELMNSIVWSITQAFINQSDFELQTEQASKIINREIVFNEKQLTNVLLKIENITKDILIATNNLTIITDDTILKILEANTTALIKERTEFNKSKESISKELLKQRTKLADFKFNIDSELLEGLTDEKKNEIYIKYIDKITYYSVTSFRGFIYIKYKNGFEATIMTSTRHGYKAYELPQSFSFNPVTRLAIEAFEPFTEPDIEQDYSFIIKPTIKREATYDQIEERYNLQEFLMSL